MLLHRSLAVALCLALVTFALLDSAEAAGGKKKKNKSRPAAETEAAPATTDESEALANNEDADQDDGDAAEANNQAETPVEQAPPATDEGPLQRQPSLKRQLSKKPEPQPEPVPEPASQAESQVPEESPKPKTPKRQLSRKPSSKAVVQTEESPDAENPFQQATVDEPVNNIPEEVAKPVSPVLQKQLSRKPSVLARQPSQKQPEVEEVPEPAAESPKKVPSPRRQSPRPKSPSPHVTKPEEQEQQPWLQRELQLPHEEPAIEEQPHHVEEYVELLENVAEIKPEDIAHQQLPAELQQPAESLVNKGLKLGVDVAAGAAKFGLKNLWFAPGPLKHVKQCALKILDRVVNEVVHEALNVYKKVEPSMHKAQNYSRVLLKKIKDADQKLRGNKVYDVYVRFPLDTAHTAFQKILSAATSKELQEMLQSKKALMKDKAIEIYRSKPVKQGLSKVKKLKRNVAVYAEVARSKAEEVLKASARTTGIVVQEIYSNLVPQSVKGILCSAAKEGFNRLPWFTQQMVLAAQKGATDYIKN